MKHAATVALLILAPSLVQAAEPGPFSITLDVADKMVAGVILRVNGRLLLTEAGVPNEPVGVFIDGKQKAIPLTDLTGKFGVLLPAGVRGPHTVRVTAEPVNERFRVEAEDTYVAVVKPTAPTALAATSLPATLLARVSWEPPTDDGGSEVTSYELFRSDGTATRSVATFPAGVRVFEEEMPPSTTWTYGVLAENMAGKGPQAAVAVTSPPLPPADLFTGATPEFRRCWEHTGCGHPWSDHIRTTTQPFRFWIPVVGVLGNEGTPYAGMPVTGHVSVTFPEGATTTLSTTVKTRSDGTYEALVGPFEWGPGDGPQDVVYVFPVSATASYGTTTLGAGDHGLAVWVGDPYGGCTYCGGGGY